MSSILLSCNARRAVTSPFLTATRNINKTVVIKNLPASLTMKIMEERFSGYGKILDIRFLPTQAHLEKFKTTTAILSYADINSALAVVDELQHAQVFNRRITVEFNRFRVINDKYPSNNMRPYEDKNRRNEPRYNENREQQKPRQSTQSSSQPTIEPSSQFSNQSTDMSSNDNIIEDVQEHLNTEETLENNPELEMNEGSGEGAPEVAFQVENIVEEIIVIGDDVENEEMIMFPDSVLTLEEEEEIAQLTLKLDNIENPSEAEVKEQEVENLSEPEVIVQDVVSTPEPVPLPPAPRSGINFGMNFFK
jgi:hypothetical protein